MAAAFESGSEEGVCHRFRRRGIDFLPAEAKNVGIIVLTGDHRLLDRADIRGANVPVAVGGDAHADAGGATKDAEIHRSI